MRSIHRLFALNLLYVFGIGLNIVLLRYLSLHIDPLNNNGVRFLAGSAVLLLFTALKYRIALRQLLRQPKNLLMALAVGVMLAANMYFWLKGTKLTNAVTASLFGVLAMPFGVLVAALFYRDEREQIRYPRFWLGSGLTIIGSLGFVWQGQALTLGESFAMGSLFLFLSITIRNVQHLLVKAAKSGSMLAFSCFTSLAASLSSLGLSAQQGSLEALHHAPLWLLGLLLAAGIYAVFVAMVLAFQIIQVQGLVTYQVLELIIPITTAICAYFLLNEAMNLMQLAFALVVIFGASWALGVFSGKKAS